MPAPVTFRGVPAARYWKFEDARIDYGLLPVGPTDLPQLLMIEYASSYGNGRSCEACATGGERIC